MVEVLFDVKKQTHKFPLYESEKKSFRIEKKPLTLEWAEKNISLVSPGYIYPGPYKARPWQREIVNAWHYWDTVIEVGAVQTGKSLNIDLPMYYCQSVLGLNGMVAYSETDTVESVFNLRIKDMIKNNAVLRSNWSGKDDDLTTSNLKLKNCLWRIASAQNKNDLATFSAAICIGSEVAKWKRMKSFNPVLMFKGRSGAFHSSSTTKLILESSPFEIGDYLYKETFKSGAIIVTPHYQCVHCGCWQEWTDYQIKLRRIGDKEPDHSPERIRELAEAGTYYECKGCGCEITETERAAVDEKVIWAAPKIDSEDFKQEAEKILEDGTIIGRLEGGRRRGYDAIAYNFSRLVDVSYQFYKCLALFFETKNDPESKRTYETETMARWPKRQARKIEVSYLEAKKVNGFYQYGDRHRIPEDVLALTYGGDTQDNGFYYAIFGWGYMMSCWLIRHDFIPCPMDPNKNLQAVFGKFREGLYVEPLRWADGMEADWRYGLQDRGGHRPEDVDYICSRMPNIKPYVGLTRVDDKRPAVFKSDNGIWFLGQPQMLSDFTGTLLGSDHLYFPWDTGKDFFDQVWRQFFEKRINTKGVQEEVWVHGYQGADHYRDCFNLAYAAAKLAGLDKKLFNQTMCETMKNKRAQPAIIPETKQEQPRQPEQVRQSVDPRRMQRGSGNYFRRAYGRGN